MVKGIHGLRPLEEQFEKPTIRRIRALQADLDSLPFRSGAGRFYATELKYALEAGLLLASLHLAASLLELFVRDLLIFSVANKTGADTKQKTLSNLDDLERYYEDAAEPQWSFAKIVDELQSQGVVSSSDAEDVKGYYKTIRIPIHHGLTRRFLRGHRVSSSESSSADMFDEFLLFGRILRAHALEERLEDKGTRLIKKVVAFVKKYSPNLAA